jgi:hypothetical protein
MTATTGAPVVETNEKDSKATWARGLAIAGSLLLVSLMVIAGSRAAFTDTTENEGNTWEAAEVSITDDDDGAALFETELMVPGDVVSNSITVTYNGNAESVDVRLYAEGYGSSDDGGTPAEDFAENLNLKIGTAAGGSQVFSGTLADFAATEIDFDTSSDTWNDVAPETDRTYHFEVELDEDTSDDHQGGDAGVTFVWEAQSNPTQS